ncbi:glycoside hydrolase family 28 protein [Belliella sp. DSM 111904]|uniref:Glycoside hydrolase family 28 protein n=1 Tax=Belliella filtrata TaxID=2923435 RepID=A0ABS9UZ42_9BACT|nr:glycoside hydrolase family 28 protein [Belliella filtrata]MCH7409348.1 glycoside hydrolase family 28 protein [Belliella filtrata]
MLKSLKVKDVIFVFVIKSLLLLSCNQSSSDGILIDQIEIEAPFEMPSLEFPKFENVETKLITEFGGEPADKLKNIKAIAEAMDWAHQNQGGRIVIPKGEWHTGKIHFKSFVNLHLEEDAVLVFSDDPEDYLPAVQTSWEGMECYNYSPLIYAFECEQIAITGQGELRAKMDHWEQWFGRPSGHMENLKRLYHLAAQNIPVDQRHMVNDSANLRPHFIQFNRSKHIKLEGVTITNSPFWVIHPYLSTHVLIRDVKVNAHGHNNDGVDPEMSQVMLIEDCVFDQGDDAIAIKSGRNQDAWRLNTPTKNLVIRNNFVKNGHQLIAVGSELSGGVENVYVHDCEVEEGAKLGHLLFIKTNERRGGLVKNIFMKNIKAGRIDLGVLGIETDVLYQWRDIVPTYERRLTEIQNVFLENIEAGDVRFVSRILGDQEMPIENIHLTRVNTKNIREEKHIHEHVKGFEEKKR